MDIEKLTQRIAYNETMIKVYLNCDGLGEWRKAEALEKENRKLNKELRELSKL